MGNDTPADTNRWRVLIYLEADRDAPTDQAGKRALANYWKAMLREGLVPADLVPSVEALLAWWELCDGG